ncbi:MAG: hypothetical protein EBS36_07240 [Actinobacteria bacterium]|nr:hypothetical protein [Actinomycetota bacterium]NBY14743.1 hypothetical protein [Actinomycetota bacterium]
MITLVNLEPQSAPVTDVTSRIFFTALVIIVILFALWAMRRAWEAKAKPFSDLPAPANAVPTGSLAVTEALVARFAGSTISGKWLHRITAHGLGTPRSVVAQVYSDGIFITDEGKFGLWISKDQLTDIRLSRGIAGDVVEPEGMVILSWLLGATSIDSGIRITRHQEHEIFYNAASNLVKGVSE